MTPRIRRSTRTMMQGLRAVFQRTRRQPAILPVLEEPLRHTILKIEDECKMVRNRSQKGVQPRCYCASRELKTDAKPDARTEILESRIHHRHGRDVWGQSMQVGHFG
jgi:hypothetical protein